MKLNSKVQLQKYKSFSRDTQIVIFNAINGLILKGGSAFIALFTTPAYMKYFDNYAVLGIWFTILSVISWILNFDMGIGNGLRNKLVKEIVNDNKEKQKKYISSAYISLFCLSCVFLIFLLVLVYTLNWNNILNISTDVIHSRTLRITVLIVLVAILLQFVLRLITSILYALQVSFIPNLLSLFTSIFMLIYVVYCNKTGHNNDLIALAINYFIAVNLPLIVVTILTFTTKLKDARPRMEYFHLKYAKEVFKMGSSFLILQFAALLISNTTIYLIAVLIGPQSIVEYDIYNKIFSQIYIVFSFITIPLWSAITKNITKKNYIWIKKTVRTLRIMALMVFLAQFSLLIFLQDIFNLWLGKQSIPINYVSIITFIIYNGIMLIYNITTTVCNGLNELRTQMKWMLVAAILNIILAYIFSQIYNNYVSLVVANGISLLPFCIFQSIWLNRYIAKLIDKEANYVN
ncbi:oligosaccharide flippase family protein [Priestia aryabhattai]|uniref:oligosaccharide flippase family protein n=1 Tax=Priestia aryabhattai TaxID=412384 RepID=UPI001FB52818|nr:oligosaccharide flippase family protein [Priestia aryabhattai]MED4000954.1 hypothetical protein [Priestia aryabhattai]